MRLGDFAISDDGEPIGPGLSRREFVSVPAMAAAGAALLGTPDDCAAAPGAMPPGPIVVIGADLGGLTAAARAAKAGFDVTLIEQHWVPGGYATAFHRVGGSGGLFYPAAGRKYTFEVSLHATGVLSDSVAPDVKAVRLPEVARYLGSGIDLILPNQGTEPFIQALAERFPGQAGGIRKLVTLMTQVTDESMRLAKQGPPRDAEFARDYPALATVQNLTLAGLFDQHVTDPTLRSVLACLWSYHGLPPSQLSAYYYAMSTGGYVKYGAHYIRDRSRDLSERLARVVKEHGGRIMLRQRVEAIQVEAGAVSGVRLVGGKTIPAKCVVSNASAPTTLQQMVSAQELPAPYLERLRGLRPSLSSFVVRLGLKAPLPSSLRSYELYLTETDDAETDSRACLEADAARAPLWLTAYDNAFAGYSTAGTSTLTLMFVCAFAPWQRFEADYRAGHKAAYRAQKEALARELIRRVERRVFPNLSASIDVLEAASPLTNARFTGNPAGAIYGFEQSVGNSGLQRWPVRKPLRGLYLASAWSTPGGGYIGAQTAGLNAFTALSQDAQTRS